MSRTRSAGALVLWLVIVLFAAWLASRFTMQGMDTWYETLRKPSFSPPDRVFAPVWTLLYLLMTLSIWLVWRSRGIAAEMQVILFTAQLLLNVLWTYLFFSLRAPGAALIEIVILWFFILATITSFRRVSSTAALLMVPYLLWVAFASALNYEIWMLNS